ncbi:acyl carrier protein [Pedobacter steynii]|uniref:Acyl carrier protein n=1 Tax=Pedobacter steynii TaxID=430522 RepID=A0A1G9WG16_9SPHI|nr:acyl carrier protein [Pedobacter steynii]NQX40288.1 acyl carrier protein [Pedobacter steynii]SDM83504.1 acyl carrier protein [Pedobacter steynii]
MNRAQIFEKVQEIFRDIFDDQSLNINDATNSDHIDDWDSLNHINLVVSIEKEFNIKFNFNELSGLKDVGAMIDLIVEKIEK